MTLLEFVVFRSASEGSLEVALIGIAGGVDQLMQIVGHYDHIGILEENFGVIALILNHPTFALELPQSVGDFKSAKHLAHGRFIN